MYKAEFIRNGKTEYNRCFVYESEMLKYLKRFGLQGDSLPSKKFSFLFGKNNSVLVMVEHSSPSDPDRIPLAWYSSYPMIEIFPTCFEEMEEKYGEILEEVTNKGEVYLERIALKKSELSMDQFNIISHFKLRDTNHNEIKEEFTKEFLINDETYVFGCTIIKKIKD